MIAVSPHCVVAHGKIRPEDTDWRLLFALGSRTCTGERVLRHHSTANGLQLCFYHLFLCHMVSTDGITATGSSAAFHGVKESKFVMRASSTVLVNCVMVTTVFVMKTWPK